MQMKLGGNPGLRDYLDQVVSLKFQLRLLLAFKFSGPFLLTH